MFVDKAKIFVKAGNGGDGAVAWRREKFEPSGGPAGGDGGNGGDVIIKVDEGLKTLMDFKYKKHYKASNGENGRAKNQYGKAGKDLILKVPPGTIIKQQEDDKIIADLTEKDDSFIVAKGGRGGKGNSKFATSTRQAPRFAKAGTKGEEKWIILELKLLADVGLLGFPNVGKSTLLSVISDAKPKIANYHFTTIRPNLGVVKIENGESFVIADIPGLIEGAHKGVGLGYDFLRHVERTKLLVHLVDVSGQEGRNPIDDFIRINDELEKYNDKLSKRHQIVVASKMDIPESKANYESFKKSIEDMGYEVYKISSVSREGINELKYIIWNKLKEIGEVEPISEIIEDVKIYEYKKERKGIIVKKEDEKYIVEGPFIERLVNSINFNDNHSLRHFQKVLRDKGVIEKLKELGVQEEDTVYICDYEFEFFD